MNFDDAMKFMVIKHAGQKRKDGTPYVYHPMTVAALVKRAGYDEKYQIAALLHDVLEDTDATAEEVAQFGDDVLEAVQLLTKKDNCDEAEYLTAILKNRIATVVKSADKIHNLWEAVSGIPGEKRDPKQKVFAEKYIIKAEQYYKGRLCEAVDDTIRNASLCCETPEYTDWKLPFSRLSGLTPYDAERR